MWVLFALVASLLTSFLPIINKQMLKDSDVSVVAWGINTLSLPLLALLTFLLTSLPQVDALFYVGIVGSGILNVLATLVSTQALKLGEASVVTPFLIFNPVFSLAVAFFTLGEVPSFQGVVGVLVVVLGAYAFALDEAPMGPLAPLRALVNRPGILLAILASFLWALTPIFEKVAILHSFPPNPPLVALATTLLLAVILLAPVARRPEAGWQQIARHKRGFSVAAGIAGVAPVFGFTAIGLGNVGYVTALFKLGAMFTVLWSALLLKEGGIRQRIPASAIMVGGSLLIAS